MMSDQVTVAIIGAAAVVAAAVLGNWLRQRPQRDEGRDYGIRIVSPSDGAAVAPGRNEVIGTYSIRPPVDSLYVVHADLNRPAYWPQVGVPIEFDASKKTWRARTWIGGDTRVFAMIVGPNGRVLFRYYEKVGRATEQWHALEELPEDVQPQGNSIALRCA